MYRDEITIHRNIKPEKDAYTISKIYSDWVAQGKEADTTALTTDNVLTVFDKLMEGMDEALTLETSAFTA